MTWHVAARTCEAELPYSGLERPALFADVLTTLLRFAYSVAPDSQLGLDLLAVARLDVGGGRSR